MDGGFSVGGVRPTASVLLEMRESPDDEARPAAYQKRLGPVVSTDALRTRGGLSSYIGLCAGGGRARWSP